MAIKLSSSSLPLFYGHEIRFFQSIKLFHRKLMGLNKDIKMENCNIHGYEKGFIGLPCDFNGILMILQLTVCFIT